MAEYEDYDFLDILITHLQKEFIGDKKPLHSNYVIRFFKRAHYVTSDEQAIALGQRLYDAFLLAPAKPNVDRTLLFTDDKTLNVICVGDAGREKEREKDVLSSKPSIVTSNASEKATLAVPLGTNTPSLGNTPASSSPNTPIAPVTPATASSPPSPDDSPTHTSTATPTVSTSSTLSTTTSSLSVTASSAPPSPVLGPSSAIASLLSTSAPSDTVPFVPATGLPEIQRRGTGVGKGLLPRAEVSKGRWFELSTAPGTFSDTGVQLEGHYTVLSLAAIVHREDLKMYLFQNKSVQRYVCELKECLYYMTQETGVGGAQRSINGAPGTPIQRAQSHRALMKSEELGVKFPVAPFCYLHLFIGDRVLKLRMLNEEDKKRWLELVKLLKLREADRSLVEQLNEQYLPMRDVLDTPTFRAVFIQFLEKHFALESLKFLEAVESYRLLNDIAIRKAAATKIFNTFIDVASAPELVNIDSSAMDDIVDKMNTNQYRRNLFDGAYQGIYNLLSDDVYSRFARTPVFLELLNDGRLNTKERRRLKKEKEKELEAKGHAAGASGAGATTTSLMPNPTPKHKRIESFVIPRVDDIKGLNNIAQLIKSSGILSTHPHWKKFRKVGNCVPGATLVEWIIKQGHATYRGAAFGMCQRLLDARFIRDVDDESMEFTDDERLYTCDPSLPGDDKPDKDKDKADKKEPVAPVVPPTPSAMMGAPDSSALVVVEGSLLMKGSMKYIPVYAICNTYTKKLYLYRNNPAGSTTTLPIRVIDLKTHHGFFDRIKKNISQLRHQMHKAAEGGRDRNKSAAAPPTNPPSLMDDEDDDKKSRDDDDVSNTGHDEQDIGMWSELRSSGGDVTVVDHIISILKETDAKGITGVPPPTPFKDSRADKPSGGKFGAGATTSANSTPAATPQKSNGGRKNSDMAHKVANPSAPVSMTPTSSAPFSRASAFAGSATVGAIPANFPPPSSSSSSSSSASSVMATPPRKATASAAPTPVLTPAKPFSTAPNPSTNPSDREDNFLFDVPPSTDVIHYLRLGGVVFRIPSLTDDGIIIDNIGVNQRVKEGSNSKSSKPEIDFGKWRRCITLLANKRVRAFAKATVEAQAQAQANATIAHAHAAAHSAAAAAAATAPETPSSGTTAHIAPGNQ